MKALFKIALLLFTLTALSVIRGRPALEPVALAQIGPTPTPQAATIQISAVITTSSSMTTPTVAQVEVLASGLNIRQGPGLAYLIVDIAQAGDLFEVIGRNLGGGWWQISRAGAGSGWISAQPIYSRLRYGRPDDVPLVTASLVTAPVLSPTLGLMSPLGGPSIPPAGSRLVFMTHSGGELYVINTDGTGLRQLASGILDPVVSPDGQQVAFIRWDGAELGSLYLINLDSGVERAIVGDIRQPKSPAWSPDGQQIVVSFQKGGVRELSEECRRYGRGEQVRIPENAITTSFRNSSDGSVRVCFIRNRDLLWRLRKIDLSSGHFEDLPSDEYSYTPAWDPNKPWRVIYDGNKGLVQLDVTNGQRWPITEDLRDTGPVFSPDGQILALTYKQHDHWEVYTLNLQTRARNRLTKPPILADPQYNSAAPAWSPDGSQIAFVTDRTGRWEIWVMNADGSQQHPLLPLSIQSQLELAYHGVHERMLNWIE